LEVGIRAQRWEKGKKSLEGPQLYRTIMSQGTPMKKRKKKGLKEGG